VVDDNPYPDAPRLKVLAHVPTRARSILDVGCNTGAFGHALKQFHPASVVWGVEPIKSAAAIASGRYDRVVVGTYPEAMPTTDRRFDCIVFNDVIEHMAQPELALETARASLSPGGTILASIPNVKYLRVVFDLVAPGHWTYTETGILDKTHLRFFTRQSIADLFARCGYEVERIVPLTVVAERFGVTRPQRLLLRDFSCAQFLVVAHV
jgi:2-polyprenyl-3-methyl-5-hydroxy-6-metoxy-1,4-benzoquinol methylase